MKTIAIIQARMGSTRLPGKVMKDLCGHPVIEWVAHRVRKAKLVDEVVVAIPISKDGYHNALSKWLEENKVNYFCGPEDDVLARYYHCAKEHDADYIVRITADCPLIDWTTIENLIRMLWLSTKHHFISNSFGKKRIRGLDVEVFTMKMLTLSNHMADASGHREHVTPYMYRMFQAHARQVIEPTLSENYGFRWTLDEQADLDMLRHLCLHGNMDTPWFEFAKICEQHPEIPKINAHVEQKEV